METSTALFLLAGAGGLFYLATRDKNGNGKSNGNGNGASGFSRSQCEAAYEEISSQPGYQTMGANEEQVREITIGHCMENPNLVPCLKRMATADVPATPEERRRCGPPIQMLMADLMALMPEPSAAPPPASDPPDWVTKGERPPGFGPPPGGPMTSSPQRQLAPPPEPMAMEPKPEPAANGVGNYVRGYLR